MFVVVFVLIGVWPWLGHWQQFDLVRPWALFISGMILCVAMVRPVVLAPANKLWMKFGLLLHRVTSPIILGCMFFVVLTPVALVMRASKKDLLGLRPEPEKETYWVERADEVPSSMKNQF